MSQLLFLAALIYILSITGLLSVVITIGGIIVVLYLVGVGLLLGFCGFAYLADVFFHEKKASPQKVREINTEIF